MEAFFDPANQWATYFEIFVVMFIAFIIGYGFGVRKSSKKQNKIVYKKQPERDPAEIETLFTELKPEIIKIIEQHGYTKQAPSNGTSRPASRTPENELGLNFENFGYAERRDKDDLTKIMGIGPYLEEKLNNLGIFTYDQISRFSKEDMDKISHLIELYPGRMERDRWREQAENLK